jgi:two-component system sensor histidine kinase YesM
MRKKKGNLTFGRTYIEKINNNKYIINYQNIRKTNLGVIQLVKHNSIFGEIERIKAVDTLIILLATAIFTVLTIIVSFKMTKPLKQLKKEMGAINDENLGHLIPEKGHDDVSELIKAYNSMVVRMRDLFEKIRYEQKQKEEIRYRFLQSQINPHFIFNTLNNIKWVAYMSQADKVGEMLSALGLLMEASIGKGEDIIILSEEIRYIDNYIYLQKLRYGDKIDVKYYIPDEILFCSVVKLMLQPLIENSIFHGFSNLKRKGLIKINARREDHDLILIVSDNGNGMDGQKLEEVRKTLEQSEYIKPAQKVGLYNVHQRIRLECGSRYGLEIQSILKSGTRVKIRLPYRNMRDIEDVGNVRGIKEIEGAAGIEYGDKEDIENIEGMENKSDVVEVEDLDDKSVDS